MKKKVFIIAGEDSGDILAAGLMRELNIISKVSYSGIGGKLMKEQGLKKSFFPMKELSVMGLDIVPQIPHFLKRINETVNEIIKTNPDVVITVDAPEFSFRVLKKLRKKNKNIKLVHYVSPSVWAWREGRAKKISKFLDAILLLWPFEKKYYPKLETFYVGHSAITRFQPCREIKSNTMMCLPGSRRKEVEGLLPIFVQVINNLYSKDKSIKVKIPVAENVSSLVKDYAKELQCKYELITDVEEKNKLNGKLALCASGTAVFEVALREIPIVSAYKMGKVAGFIGKLVLKSKWVTLPNIIMNKAILSELLQKDCTVEKIQAEVEKLLYNEKNIAKQRKSFVAMRKKLQAGEISPDIEAAKAIKNILN